MKVLCIIPPVIPSYFNAGHHLPVFQVAAYLRGSGMGSDVTCIDAAAVHRTWKDVCDLLVRKFDVIAVMNDFDQVDTFRRFCDYARRLSPSSKLVTFGRLSKQIPGFFERFGFDGIVESGDYEAGVLGFLRVARGDADHAPGVRLRAGGAYTSPVAGRYLSADEWHLPDVREIPYRQYEQLYRNDLNKFCGIPERCELVVPVARGCPIGCSFCDVPSMQGTKERRLSVARTLEYIEASFASAPFEYVSFYAPTFTLDKPWVRELCRALVAMGSPYPWKCVTTLAHLGDELIELMAKSGCVRISVGLETLDPQAFKALPMIKRDSKASFEHVAERCAKHGIELNCFVILGLPGDTYEGVAATVEHVLRHGARVRPTIYTPYHLLRDDMAEHEVSQFNRQLLVEESAAPELAERCHELFHANDADRATTVMSRIPVHTHKPPVVSLVR
jgi:hypothetical protein